MKIYDSLINQFREKINDLSIITYPYDEKNQWDCDKDFELILQKDTALELGAADKKSLNITMLSTDEGIISRDEVCLIGKDIKDIEGNANYARITEVLVRPEVDTYNNANELYNMVSDIDFVKYHVYPKGYMFRSSGQSYKEQVRISKEAVKNGIDFDKIGNTFIARYKENKDVVHVRITFITLDDFDYSSLIKLAETAGDIKKSLSQIKKGLPTECAVCEIKEICNEVEGLRELHFGKKRN